jgi:hypothetical protein
MIFELLGLTILAGLSNYLTCPCSSIVGMSLPVRYCVTVFAPLLTTVHDVDVNIDVNDSIINISLFVCTVHTIQ